MPPKVAEYELYKRIKLLGEGSFGKAYLVECLHDKSIWVIKYMDLTAMTAQEKDETLREAKILEYLKHPNIVQFKEVYKTKKGKLCIVMEFADGGDLAKKVKDARGKYFSEAQILDWFTQLCLAMKHVHDRKIIHRDLKCQNIFLTKDNRIKLGDFGIARILKKTMEKAKTMVGTPYYISPEIIEGKQYSLMTDIWSLGVVLYELCTLNPPFNAESLHYLALKIVKGQYTPIPSHYSRELKNLVTSLLQVDPRRRPTIQEILKMPVIINRIKGFLTESVRNVEFSHTILHKQAFDYQGNLNNINLIEKEQPCPENLIEKQMKDLQSEFPPLGGQKQPPTPKIVQKQPSSNQLLPSYQSPQIQQKPITAPNIEQRIEIQKDYPVKLIQQKVDVYKNDQPDRKNLQRNEVLQNNDVSPKLVPYKYDVPKYDLQQKPFSVNNEPYKYDQQKSEPSREIKPKNDYNKLEQINERQNPYRNEAYKQPPQKQLEAKLLEQPYKIAQIAKPGPVYQADENGSKYKQDPDRIISTPSKPQSSPFIQQKPPQNPLKELPLNQKNWNTPNSNNELVQKNSKPPVISGKPNQAIQQLGVRSNESNLSQQSEQQSSKERKEQRIPSAQLIQNPWEKQDKRPSSSNEDLIIKKQPVDKKILQQQIDRQPMDRQPIDRQIVDRQKVGFAKQRPVSEYRSENNKDISRDDEQRRDEIMKKLKMREAEKNNNKNVRIDVDKKLNEYKAEADKRMQEQQKALDKLIAEKEARKYEDQLKIDQFRQQQQKQQQIQQQKYLEEQKKKDELKKKEEMKSQEDIKLKQKQYQQQKRNIDKVEKKSNPDLNRQKMEVANREFEQMLSELNGILEGLNSKVEMLPNNQQNKNIFELESKINDQKGSTPIEDREDDDSDLEDEKIKGKITRENNYKKPRQLTKEEENGLLLVQEGKIETLKIRLTEQLGEEKFQKAYQILKQKFQEMDLEQFEAKFGTKYQQILPFLNPTQIRDCVPLIITYIVTQKEF